MNWNSLTGKKKRRRLVLGLTEKGVCETVCTSQVVSILCNVRCYTAKAVSLTQYPKKKATTPGYWPTSKSARGQKGDALIRASSTPSFLSLFLCLLEVIKETFFLKRPPVAD